MPCGQVNQYFSCEGKHLGFAAFRFCFKGGAKIQYLNRVLSTKKRPNTKDAVHFPMLLAAEMKCYFLVGNAGIHQLMIGFAIKNDNQFFYKIFNEIYCS